MTYSKAESYNQMWIHIENELYEMSSDKYNEDLPDIKLIIAVIVQAGKDVIARGDYEEDAVLYLNSPLFVEHTNLLRLKPKYIANVLTSAWDVIDSDEPWAGVPQEIEEWDI